MSSPAPAGKPSLKVPSENNRFLCLPSASDTRKLLEDNHSRLSDRRLSNWFHQLRGLARLQALQASKKYMQGYAPWLAQSISDGGLEGKPWVVGGHQPEFFHPGVWFKNFLIYEIGKRTGSVGFQVIIDHDVARSDTLRVPSFHSPVLGNKTPRLTQRSIPLPIRAEWEPRMPWHTTRNGRLAPELWDKTIDSVGRSMKECGLAPPIILSRRKMLAECIANTTNIGDAFSHFRHRIEMEHDVSNLEVPIGHLCDGSAFGLFVLHCVNNAESLWTTYNSCRDAYRVRHKIRNQGQPVLELQRQGDWFELPFWIYRRSSKTVVRNRLWVCKQQDRYLLSDSVDPSKRTVSVELAFDEQELPNRWNELVERGICIRPRALMTTMYLRCFVSDLFVHGIGGGTYDELTDDILWQWLSISPPSYMISSASLYLPFTGHDEIGQIDPTSNSISIQRELHLMRSVPERFLDQTIDSHRELRTAHSRQIARIPARGQKRIWHQRISEIRQQIEIAIEPKKRFLLEKMEALQTEIQQGRIRNSREYSFVLFDETDVVGRLSRLAKAAFDKTPDSGK